MCLAYLLLASRKIVRETNKNFVIVCQHLMRLILQNLVPNPSGTVLVLQRSNRMGVIENHAVDILLLDHDGDREEFHWSWCLRCHY